VTLLSCILDKVGGYLLLKKGKDTIMDMQCHGDGGDSRIQQWLKASPTSPKILWMPPLVNQF